MKESMRNHLIEIYVDPNTKNFTYRPAVYHARPGAPVAWRANGTFAIQFTGGTPLEKTGIHGRVEEVFESKIRSDARGIYHYAVAVAIGDEVFLDAGCPTIVIG